MPKMPSKMINTPKPQDWDKQLDEIETVINHLKPEDFLTSSSTVSIKTLKLLKSLYDFTKSTQSPASESCCNFLSLNNPNSLSKSKKKQKKFTISKVEYPLEKLIVEDFDADQIWEEIQLQNNVLHDSLVSSISKILAQKNRQASHSQKMSRVQFDDDEVEDGSGSDTESVQKKKLELKRKPQMQKSYPKSVVDDKFFNLAQMTEFLEKVESKIAYDNNSDLNPLKRHNNEESNSESEDSIDLFEDIDEDDDGDEGEDEEQSTNVYYNEFFDQPLDEQSSIEMEDQSPLLKPKYLASNLESKENDSKDEEMEDESDDEIKDLKDLGQNQIDQPSSDEEDKVVENLSNFEKRRKKIEESIDMIEEEALQPKAWHLKGEVTAVSRPENSLLEEHLIYDHLVRQAPEVTVETTKKLEDIIKQRIKDQAWDDVERKIKPIEDASEYKKRLVLDAEKSKLSLAQIYEQEYIKQKKREDGINEDDQEPEEFIQIRKEMEKVFAQLDTLSNFHFTPAKPTLEIKFINDAPSISVEEVTPITVSDATLLAPQEISAQLKGELKGNAERTSTDKKRERRMKKKKQKLKRIAQEEKSKLKGLGLRNVKLADNVVKSSMKSKTKEDKGKIHQKELKSSKAFFTKLQEQAQTQVRDIVKGKKKKSVEKQLSAKKFKM